jgi:hypothetical protein
MFALPAGKGIIVIAKGEAGVGQSVGKHRVNMPLTSHPTVKYLGNSAKSHNQNTVPTPEKVERVLCAAVSQAAVAAMLAVITAIEEFNRKMACELVGEVLIQDPPGSSRYVLCSLTRRAMQHCARQKSSADVVPTCSAAFA